MPEDAPVTTAHVARSLGAEASRAAPESANMPEFGTLPRVKSADTDNSDDAEF